MADRTPDYDSYQSSFHEAFRLELYRILDALPVPAGGRVLDVPCGNGFYTRRLAEHFGETVRLTAVDASDAYLTEARETVAGDARAAVEFLKVDAYQLPFADAAFDLVWCAQSLISLDPEPAVREMHRVTKADGTTAVLEVDEFHHVLLPWPTELEAALPAAMHAASVQKYGDGMKLAPARQLRRVLKRCGFRSVRRVTHPIERVAPFDPPTAAFLKHHFRFLRSLVRPNLSAALQTAFDRLTDPDAADSLFRLPDVEMMCLNAVYLARPAATERTRPGRVRQ